jgi:hypothetical protein
LYLPFISSLRATCPTNLIVLALIILLIFGVIYKLWGLVYECFYVQQRKVTISDERSNIWGPFAKFADSPYYSE